MSDERDDLNATIANLIDMVTMYAEGMKRMTDVLVTFDRRLREIEASPLLKSKILPVNGFGKNPLGSI